MKLQEFETLLNLPHECDIDVYGISTQDMLDVQRVYGGQIETNPNNACLSIKTVNGILTLNTITFKKQ